MEMLLPSRVIPKTLIVDPIRQNKRRLQELPIPTKSSTETAVPRIMRPNMEIAEGALPTCANVLKDNEDPKCKQSNTEVKNGAARPTLPLTEKALPKRHAARMETHEDKCT
jgi:hypothetical protein